MEQPTRYTDRLTLRLFTLDDASDVQRLAGRKKLQLPLRLYRTHTNYIWLKNGLEPMKHFRAF